MSPDGDHHTHAPRVITSNTLTRRTLWGLIAATVSVFIVGVVLLGVGFIKFTRPNPSVPYMWSLTLCRVDNTEKWVGVELNKTAGEGVNATTCPSPLPENGTPQYINIPAGVLKAGVPYSPVLYVTNKVEGTITFAHEMNNEDIFYHSARLRALEVQHFAYCGGMELVILRDGPLWGEGDYKTTDCQNAATGCQYEPARSLNGYHINGATVKSNSFGSEDSRLEIHSIILEASRTSISMPDAYIHYEVGTRGEEQNTGLILLVIGGIMADLMPAALYFLVSKPAVPST